MLEFQREIKNISRTFMQTGVMRPHYCSSSREVGMAA